MKNNKHMNYLVCGACAVAVDENGNTTTSIDMLVNSMKRLSAKREMRTVASPAYAASTR